MWEAGGASSPGCKNNQQQASLKAAGQRCFPSQAPTPPAAPTKNAGLSTQVQQRLCQRNGSRDLWPRGSGGCAAVLTALRSPPAGAAQRCRPAAQQGVRARGHERGAGALHAALRLGQGLGTGAAAGALGAGTLGLPALSILHGRSAHHALCQLGQAGEERGALLQTPAGKQALQVARQRRSQQPRRLGRVDAGRLHVCSLARLLARRLSGLGGRLCIAAPRPLGGPRIFRSR